ncbi:polysaccharide pyruvyl transferase family protein [Exiguobacterium sp. s189]|uniref:polysaccharide pyruvyl transferase family protein n=1 Tax=Exiguobacterium sp. s189 TaxID=2751263 RepID=UPI001BEAFC44|nr:polysaccharide pyruvyl transferase family protein [Exiguobacterium sp. s189]
MDKKILLIGEYYSSNLGDGIICQSVEYLIKKWNPSLEISISDLSGKVGFDEKDISSPYPNKDNTITFPKKLVKKILKKSVYLQERYRFFLGGGKEKINNLCDDNFDCAVFAGGQMFLDYFSIPINEHVKQLDRMDVPVIFNSCGMGHIKSKQLIYKFRRTLGYKNVVSISVRDDVDSVNNVIIKKGHKKAIKSYDPGLWSGEVYNVKRKESETIGLGVMSIDAFKDKNIISQYRKIILELNKKKIAWKLFCNGNINDYNLAISIAESLGYDKSAIANRPETPKELVELISKFKGIISFRLHSHIVAVALNIPSIALSWDNKLNHFFDSINRKDRCLNINAEHKEIIDKYFFAEKEGYDLELIHSQKIYAKNLLIDNICIALSK